MDQKYAQQIGNARRHVCVGEPFPRNLKLNVSGTAAPTRTPDGGGRVQREGCTLETPGGDAWIAKSRRSREGDELRATSSAARSPSKVFPGHLVRHHPGKEPLG